MDSSNLERVYHLLSVARMANDWPQLHKLRDRAMAALEEEVNRKEVEPVIPPSRPVIAPRPIRKETNG